MVYLIGYMIKTRRICWKLIIESFAGITVTPKLNPCTNLGVFVQVYPTCLLKRSNTINRQAETDFWTPMFVNCMEPVTEIDLTLRITSTFRSGFVRCRANHIKATVDSLYCVQLCTPSVNVRVESCQYHYNYETQLPKLMYSYYTVCEFVRSSAQK